MATPHSRTVVHVATNNGKWVVRRERAYGDDPYPPRG
jgi:hypothetical protein